MSDVFIDPESVSSHAASAGADLDRIRHELVRLVNDLAAVDRPVAVEFAAGVLANVAAIVEAVQSATAAAGVSVAISCDTRPIPMPTVGAVDTVALDPTELTLVVRRHFTALDACLNDHLRSLKATRWDGAAKADAVVVVSTLTRQTIALGNDAELAITTHIAAQTDAGRPQSV